MIDEYTDIMQKIDTGLKIYVKSLTKSQLENKEVRTSIGIKIAYIKIENLKQEEDYYRKEISMKRKFKLCMLSVCIIVITGCTKNTQINKQENSTSTKVIEHSTTPIVQEKVQDTNTTKLDKLVPETIVRYPETGTAFMTSYQNQKTLNELLTPDEIGTIDVRCADLSKADLSKSGNLLLNAAFDSQTKWPNALPNNVHLKKLVKLGKDPGLGIRKLHKKGITGKGVGIAIIDQTLLVDHKEYADRVRLYQEYNTAAQDPASMHGAAVASIALGKHVGVAPDALLYYIADDVGTGTEEEGNFIRDMRFYAKDIDRLIELNKTLPDGEKIRVISMSVGYISDTKGAAEMDAAIARARAAKIAVVYINSNDELMENYAGMGWKVYGNTNNWSNSEPGRYLEEIIYNGEYTGKNSLLIPMDRRTTAAQTGKTDYAYYPSGGASWTRPYIAGLFALACQVKPEVTFEEFTQAALATAHPVSVSHKGKDYPYGKVIDPAALLDKICDNQ